MEEGKRRDGGEPMAGSRDHRKVAFGEQRLGIFPAREIQKGIEPDNKDQRCSGGIAPAKLADRLDRV